VTELCLSEFLCFGPQKEGRAGKSLLRKTKEGKILEWNVEKDDSLCTLQDAFQQVESSLGFNIELKFDDHIVYQQDYLIRVLQAILQVHIDDIFLIKTAFFSLKQIMRAGSSLYTMRVFLIGELILWFRWYLIMVRIGLLFSHLSNLMQHCLSENCRAPSL